MEMIGEIIQKNPKYQGEIDNKREETPSVIGFSNQTPEDKPKKKMTRADVARINGLKGGRPKGALNPETIAKNDAWKEYRTRVTKMTDRLLDTQTSLAFGIQLLFKVEEVVESRTKLANGKENVKTRKKIVQVEDPHEIRAYIAHEEGIDDEDGEYDFDNETYYFLTAKKPNLKAIQDMLDRTYGKAPLELNTKHTAEGVLGQMMKAALEGRSYNETSDDEIYDETIKTIEIEPESENPEKTEPQDAPEGLPKKEDDAVVMEKESDAQDSNITVPDCTKTPNLNAVPEVKAPISKKDILMKIEHGTRN